MGWGLEFDQQAESGYASEPIYELDGPSGHQTVTLPFTVPAEGTYTVTAHWTESCGDGVTPDRAVTSRPGTFKGIGPRPPFGGVELRQGGRRLPGGRREPATALLHVGCPNNRVDEPLRVTASSPGGGSRSSRRAGASGTSSAAGRAGRRSAGRSASATSAAQIFVRAPAT